MSQFIDKILARKNQNSAYVIAELGSNYKSQSDLFGAITLAKACGADAIKYQYLTKSELFGPAPEIDRTFPLRQLREKCDAVGIDFLCSSFSPEGLKEVDQFVDAHKIASSEMNHVRLLKAAKDTKKPIILSTGAFFMADIQRTLKFLEGSEIVLMHCNVKYPAKYTKLKKFDSFKGFSGPIGFSDHTTSVDIVPMFYKDRGASVIEKHFNPFDYTDTPDAPHSLSTEEFKCMVSYLRNDPNDFDEENEARLKHLRRVVALKDLNPGDRLVEGETIGIYRSKVEDASGVSPFAIDRLEGKAATKVVKAGHGVSLLDVT